MIAVVVAAVGGSFAVAAATGSLHLPQNDDWAYVKSALELHRTGDVELQGWGQMFLVGQLVAAQPFLAVFGGGIAALQVFGLATTALLLGTAGFLARRIVGPWRAVLAVAGLACWPTLGVLAASFMTDLPSAGAAMLCVAVGAVAVERRSMAGFAAAMVVGIWAFTIREQMIFAPVAVLAAALVVRGGSRRFRVAGTAMFTASVAVCLVLEHWRHQQPYGDLPPFGLDTLNLSRIPPSLGRELFTLGLSLAPLCAWRLLSLSGRDWLAPGRIVGWALGLIAFVRLPSTSAALSTNYIIQGGPFNVAVPGHPPPVLGPAIMNPLEILAVVTGIVLLGEVVHAAVHAARRWRDWRDASPAVLALTVFTALSALALVGLAFAGQVQRDRYLMPVLPGVAVLLLTGPPVRRPAIVAGRWLAFGAVAVALSVVSWDLTVSADVRDVAVWNAAEKLAASGVPAADINAGLDWNGLAATTPADRPRSWRMRENYYGRHWTNVFPASRDCYVVSASRFEGPHWRLLARTTSRPYGLHGVMRTFTYKRTNVCAD